MIWLLMSVLPTDIKMVSGSLAVEISMPSVVAQATDINTNLSALRTCTQTWPPTVAQNGIFPRLQVAAEATSDLYDPQKQHSPQTSP